MNETELEQLRKRVELLEHKLNAVLDVCCDVALRHKISVPDFADKLERALLSEPRAEE